VTGGERARGEPTSLERVEWIVGLESDPIRRNLLITQCYHDLSASLAQRLGAGHANWCTFATWASRTAGRFIRDEEVPAVFRDVLAGSTHVDRGIERANRALGRVNADATIRKDVVLDIARRIVHEVGELITEGNVAVFGELGPVFSRTIAALHEDADGSALLRLGATLREGPSERGGQTRLRLALNGYARARAEPDPHRKAELMLLANARIGRHEQIRLQPFIAGSIDAPVRVALLDPADEAARRLPRGLRTACRGALRLALREAGKEAQRHWEELCTRELMTLELPGETLVLGRQLPSPKGQPLYPKVLDPVDDPETLDFLRRQGADRPAAAGGAVNWTRLDDRMRYIADLFRSRQLDASLQGGPFTAEQRRQLDAGRPASGKL
jgi:hypothetical protein